MPCPKCGAPTYNVMDGMDPVPLHQRCLGLVKRQGMRRRKDGTEAWCRVHEDPCGWERGRQADEIPSVIVPEPVGETPVPGHTTDTGRLVLADYRAG